MWAGPSRVDAVRVVEECVVWVASEGLVTTPITGTQAATAAPPTTTTTADEATKDTAEDDREEGHSSITQYIRSPPFTKLDAVEVRLFLDDAPPPAL